MNYFSLNKQAKKVNFQEAVSKGLAEDNGLYFPESMTPLPNSFFENIENISNEEIAFTTIKQFVDDEIPEIDLRKIVSETINFKFPLVKVEKNVYSLELFHGPTMAFKDVGARFMSRCLNYFDQGKNIKRTILVATSGDTGGAVAAGFLGLPNIKVVILYPSGKVSEIQERQLTTLGQNITALEVNGVFDDCQDMVKRAFLDESLKHKNLTSANSINVGRWIPQMFYYFFAYKELKKHKKPIIVSCPSGNFGNICAGILAKRLGLPIEHFVAATNSNDVVPKYINSGKFEPSSTVSTISNAMDVGNPSNFVRVSELYNNKLEEFRRDFTSYSFSDAITLTTMMNVYKKTDYILEPHGAVGYLGLKHEMELMPETIGVFLETAHPIKFADIVENSLNVKIPITKQMLVLGNNTPEKIVISEYAQLVDILNS